MESPMKYMMFVATDTEPEPDSDAIPDIEQWIGSVQAAGKHVIGERLRPVDAATTVRVRKGELLVTDGAFAETKEWIAGFDVLECDNLDEAIEIASRHPMAYQGRIELRPFWPLGEDS
jgi:hypothetical protein